MNAITGGLLCRVTYDDDLGGSFDVRIEQDVSAEKAEEALRNQHPDAANVVCT